jgi:hypothetical protein
MTSVGQTSHVSVLGYKWNTECSELNLKHCYHGIIICHIVTDDAEDLYIIGYQTSMFSLKTR